MSDLNIQLCPETGICSIIKKNGEKIDLMPFEVKQIRDAAGNSQAIKDTLADVDPDFVDGLDSDEISQVSEGLS